MFSNPKNSLYILCSVDRDRKKKNALIDEHESAGVSTEATKGTKTQTAAGEGKAGIKAWNRRGMERK